MLLTAKQVVESQLYIGSLKKESSPKTRKYRADTINGIVILDPEKIAEKLELVKTKIGELQKEKKSILVACDKSVYTDELKALSTKHKFHYLNDKVPPGFLTNFDTLTARIKSLNKEILFMDSEDFLRLTKKEQVAYKRNVTKVEKIYGGVRDLTNKPDFVIVFDGAMMSNFLREIKKEKIDNVVMCSTDFGQWRPEENLVVANMKSYKSIDFIFQYIFASWSNKNL